MDRTVPIAAARMLDFIRATEVGTDGPSGYQVIYGFNQDKLPTPITQMTIDAVIAAQASFTKRFGSSATGGYQFMRATLKDLKRELGLRGTQVLDPDLQDRLGYHLLKRRGYEAFMAGRMRRGEVGKRLAMEWASFPVLADTRGAHRDLERGQSYYSGDALNKALVSPEEVERVIDEMATIGEAMPAQAHVPLPQPEAGPIGGGRVGSQTSKAKGAAVGGAAGVGGGMTIGFAVAHLAAMFGVLPPTVDVNSLGAILTLILAPIGGVAGPYFGAWFAPKNAE